MIRRAFLAFLAAAPAAAAAQLLPRDPGRPAISRGGRPGVDEALRRTVTLVLRAEARQTVLPLFMLEPEPLAEDQMARLVVGAPVPEDVALEPAPESVNRRLPHSSSRTIWAVAGTAMVEVDPIRNRVLSIAHDVLPP
ncbi:MAG: hypothetical protein EA355_10585, partial [Rhodobacteraceae bacterium]